MSWSNVHREQNVSGFYNKHYKVRTYDKTKSEKYQRKQLKESEQRRDINDRVVDIAMHLVILQVVRR